MIFFPTFSLRPVSTDHLFVFLYLDEIHDGMSLEMYAIIHLLFFTFSTSAQLDTLVFFLFKVLPMILRVTKYVKRTLYTLRYMALH